MTGRFEDTHILSSTSRLYQTTETSVVTAIGGT